MTDELDPTTRTRDPFADPVTGDQTVPEDVGGRSAGGSDTTQVSNAGAQAFPTDTFTRPDPDQPVEGRRDQPESNKETDRAQAEDGR